MTSNRSSSKLIDFKMIFGSMRRTLWLPTLVFLGLFFAMPVAAALRMQTAMIGINTQWEELALYVFEPSNFIIKFVFIVAALVSGLVVFSYLHSQKKVDFYHSLPVSRTKLFVNNYLAGFFNVLLPYLLAIILTLIVIMANGAIGYMAWGSFFAGIGTHLLCYLSIYTVVVLAAVLAGNVVVNFLVTGVLLAILPMCVAMYNWVMITFYTTFYGASFNIERLISYTSPFTRYIVITDYSYSLGLRDAGFLALFTVLVFALSLFLYRKRASEVATTAIAFKWVKPILKYPVIAICAVGFGLMLHEISGRVNNGESYFWLYFGFVCGGIISSRIIEIIYAFDFKAIKKNWVSLAVFAVIFGCVMAIPIADLTHYDTYLPEANEVAAVAVSLNDVDNFATDKTYDFDSNNYSNGTDKSNLITFKEEGSIAAAINLMDKAVKTTEEPQDDIYGDYYSEEYLSVGVVYTLKNGKKVERYYTDLPRTTFVNELAGILDTSEYKTQRFAELNKNIDEIKIGSINSFEAASVDNNFNLQSLSVIKKQNLLDTYKEEFLALNSATMKNTMPIGSIEIMVMLDSNDPMLKGQNIVLDKGQSLSYSISYPIYPTFNKTLSMLTNLGLNLKVFEPDLSDIVSVDIGTPNEVNQKMFEKQQAMQGQGMMSQSTTTESVETEIKTITDKAEIAKVIKESYADAAYGYNPFIVANRAKTITVNYVSQFSDYGAVSRYYPLK